MIRSILSLKETPTPDAADAIAVGLAHIYTKNGIDASTGKKSEPI